MRSNLLSILLYFLLTSSVGAMAQKLAVKTNLLYDATTTVNLGAEYRVAPKWTMEVSANYNNWNPCEDRRWKNWSVQPEARYWFCEAFGGHFVGMHVQGGKYNVGNLDNDIKLFGTDFSKISDERYQGWFLGAGVAYGYSWIVSRHWNVEAEIGIGYNYTKSDRYPCAHCGTKIEEGKVHHYFGPTKAALNLVYQF